MESVACGCLTKLADKLTETHMVFFLSPRPANMQRVLCRGAAVHNTDESVLPVSANMAGMQYQANIKAKLQSKWHQAYS